MLIYKIFRAAEWAELQAAGETRGAPIDLADGYVHFSTADQAVETAAKHFAQEDGLWLLAIEIERLGGDVVWEESRGGALFPHLYGVLRMEHVVWARPLPLGATGHLFPEAVAGYVDPTRTAFDAFKAMGRDVPIDMLNLVRLRSRAAYPGDHVLAGAEISGAEAYASYGRETAELIAGLGVEIVWRGAVDGVLTGPEEEQWDHAFVARYPSAHAFLAMVSDAGFGRAVVHRQAAVRTSRLIRCAPRETGAGFA